MAVNMKRLRDLGNGSGAGKKVGMGVVTSMDPVAGAALIGGSAISNKRKKEKQQQKRDDEQKQEELERLVDSNASA